MACTAVAPHRPRLKVKGSYIVFNCGLRHRQYVILGQGRYKRQFVERSTRYCVQSRDGPCGFHWKQGVVHSICWKVSSSRRQRQAIPRGGQGESKGDKCMDMVHFTRLYNVDTNTTQWNIKWKWLQLTSYVCVCAHVFEFSGELQGDDLLRSGDVCWKGKQSTCQTHWHFCSGNTNLGWQYKSNPDMHSPHLHHQPACRQAAPPGRPLSLPLSAASSLTSWQPALATSTRTLPFLACCLHWHPTAAADDQMGFWENVQELFLYGTLSKQIRNENTKRRP